MHGVSLYLLFTMPLDAAGIRYMTTGSVAAMLYGEPRLTNDIDIVIELHRSFLQRFVDSFPFDSFYCPPVEVLAVESGRSRRGHFNLLHHDTGFKADIYLAGDDPLHDWGLARRRRVELQQGAEGIWVAPPEYVILRKLQYYAEGGSKKHVLDIRGILEISEESLNMAELEKWIQKLSLREPWSRITGSTGMGS